ncbi:ROK family protein [Deinococcus oregonensis]|uniref:ROK family protein n=1 Tax=Deinococcus oregonensis TaxID=1805970 RepID=A0ABV6AU45_9DEIO
MSIQARVLQLIRQQHEISQAELRFQTGLSASAISGAVRRVQSLGLIHEVGSLQEALGRPRTLLSLNADYAYTVGIQLDVQQSHIVLSNLRGKVVHKAQLSHAGLIPAQIAEDVAHFISEVSGHRIVGIGLAVSGIIDAERGVCLDSATTVGWQNVPIGPVVAERTGIATSVENDANALALAEMLFGEARHDRSFIVVTLGKGIGAGIIIDRKLYRGRTGVAGEIGHLSVSSAASYRCSCGKTDCLEATASSRAIACALSERLGVPVPPEHLRETLQNEPDVAQDILGHAGTRLGAVLAVLATVFDPDALYVAPEQSLHLPAFQQAVTTAFQSGVLPLCRAGTNLRFLAESEDMWARGAASVAIERFFGTAVQA